MSLPNKLYLSDAARTEGEQKVAFEDQRDAIAQLPGGAAPLSLTIDGGTVLPTKGDGGATFVIDNQGGAATDNLDRVILTNLPDGTRFRLRAANALRVPTIKHGNTGSGELLMVDGADFVLDAVDKWIVFDVDGTSCIEHDRSYGADQDGWRAFLGLSGNVYANTVRYTTAGVTDPSGRQTDPAAYVKPVGLKLAIVEIVGGGGGGGYADPTTGNSMAGYGGRGAGYAKALIEAGDLGASEVVTIGAGGAGGIASSTTNATDGAASTFGAHLTANGGDGNLQSTPSAVATFINHGNGGSATVSTGTEIANVTGGAPGTMMRLDGDAALGADGGESMLGLGGRGGFSSIGTNATAGGNALGAGAGGGGGAARDTSNANGGAGSAGTLIIHEYF